MGSAVNTIGSFGSLRNRIINGDMKINQRYVSTTATPAAASYTLDRWKYNATQASIISVSRQSATPPSGFTNYLRATVVATNTPGSSDYFGVVQPIEANNISDFNLGTASAKPFSVSFWLRSSISCTLGGSLRTGAGSNMTYPFSVSLVANTWTWFSLAIPGPTAGTWGTGTSTGMELWFTMASGATYLGTANSWQASNLVSAAGSTNLTATLGTTLDITGVQLELSPTASPFEFRPQAVEMVMCQRYYEKSYSTDIVPGTSNDFSGAYEAIALNATDTYNYGGGLRFATIKRVAPTMSFWAPGNGTAGAWWVINTSIHSNTVGTRHISTGGVGSLYYGNNTMTAGYATACQWAADAEL